VGVYACVSPGNRKSYKYFNIANCADKEEYHQEYSMDITIMGVYIYQI